LSYNHLNKDFFLIIFLLISCQSFSQLINTTTTLPVDQLVQQALGNNCMEISNVTSSINGSVDGLNSFGSFTQGGSSFPFSEGLFLSTGDGNRIGNTLINTDLSDGTAAWTGDNDLENFTGITNTVNATVIEFDLISTSNRISFNYLLASEEYQLDFPCNVGDRFALLLRPQGGAYQNIAVLPNTNTPVGIDTIHTEVVGQCPAANQSFFAGQMLGDTNFEGRTVTLTAAAAVLPNTVYHLKMVIADQSNFDPTAYDSAIFIEAGSLQAEVDLGPDLFPCIEATLNADIGNNLATFRWFRDNIELLGQTSSAIVADTTGNYRVEISVALPGSDCIITDDVFVTVDPNQLNINIADQSLCDDSSADSFESFDLLNLGNNALTQLPAGSYTTDFYFDQTDAQNEVNQLPDNYTNTINPQTIYIRINDLNTGCQGIQPVQLIVNDALVATDFTFTACDDNGDSILNINLSNFDSGVTTATSNVAISYHLTESEALNNTSPLSGTYTNFSNPDTIFARVYNTISGCFAVSEVTINIVLPPSLNSDLEVIDACDTDQNGFATFNLSSVIPDFTTTPNDFNISYHTSQADADNNVNAITNPNSYDNITPRIQRVYIRFESLTTGCANISPLDLYTNLLLDRTNIIDQLQCDDISNDGFESFNLEEIALEFINGIPNVNIEFFESEMDQLSDINQLDPLIGYTNLTNPQTLYIRINSPTCTEFAEFEIMVEPYFESEPIADQTYCDEDQDLVTSVPLNEFDNAVRGTFGNDHSVLYYLSQSDADDRINTVNSVVNTTNPFTVYAELIAPNGCSYNQTMQISILPAPVSGTPAGFMICDNDQDGFSLINLTSQETQITTEANRAITYHNNFLDAELGSNPISNPTNYNTQTTSIFVRVENTITGCETVVLKPVIINTLPVFPSISTYQLCESDADNVEDFFFFTKDFEILNGQMGKTVRYYRNSTAANARNNEIDKFNAYQNTSNPQTIWARVENDTDTSCYGVDSFLIQVDESPTYNPPADLRICDDDNDDFFTFDLQQSIDEIRAGITANLTVSFHVSIIEAESNTNPLGLNFTNTVNPQTIYARIGNDVNCFVVEDIVYNVIATPQTNDISPSILCDTDLDGFAVFDLTTRETNLVGSRPFNSILSWHTSIADATNDLNPISNETSFTNTANPQSVYLRYYNTVSMCYSIGTLDLMVNLPPELLTVSDFIICENPTQTAQLNEVTPMFISPLPAGFSTSFYTTNLDAINATNALNTDYNYTANNTSLFIRVENGVSGCFSTAPFNLRILAAPQIASAGSYDIRACDDNFDGIRNFNLSSNISGILNGLDPTNHSVQFYPTLIDADAETNQITDTNVFVNQSDTFYIRVTNATTNCSSNGAFEAFVDPLPILVIDPVHIICNNTFINVGASNAVFVESYLWSTGETTSNININTAGNYSVQVTSNRGCTAPSINFTVTESETPMVNFVASTSFGDPNSITVTVNGIGDYRFVLDNGPAQLSNLFTNVSRGFHEVSVIDLNGCAPSLPQLVFIIDYPRFFTPNNDSFNDTWYVEGIDTFDKATFYIFDRYGKLLKSYSKDNNGWDGIYNGNPMPSSDYWFLLEIKDARGDIEVKGHFSLKR
jgi:gliding motility-associated-like protein